MTRVIPPDGKEASWQAAQEAVGALLAPEAIAVVGASNTDGKPGNVLLKNVLDNDFEGRVYPINPNAEEVLGRPAYASLEATPGDIDSVLFAVPGSLIADMIPACAEKNVTSIVVVSAGFGESVDVERRALQERLVDLCADHGIRAIGPNTTGIVSKKGNLVASFIPFPTWHEGSIALGAQTGIFAGVYMEEVMAREVQTLGYSYSLAMGNKMDLDETEFVKYAGLDGDIEVVQLHLECIREPDSFFPAAAHVGKTKPVVLLKTGRTPEGRAMARYHTGSESSLDAEVDSACRASGIVRSDTVPAFMNYVKGFSYQPAPTGRHVAVLSLSGANAVMAADYISESTLELASLSDETLAEIKELVPDWQPIRNPVDQWLALPNGHRTAQEAPLKSVLADENVDSVVTIHLATAVTDFDGVGEMYVEATAEHPEKPVLSYIMGSGVKDDWIASMEGTDIPVFDSAYEAVDTLEKMYQWRRYTDGAWNYDTGVEEPGKTI